MRDPVELDDVARRVIAEGRHAFEPSELVSARVRRSVGSKLAQGAVTPTWQGAHGAPGWVKVLVGAAAASFATAALAYAVWRPRPAPLHAVISTPTQRANSVNAGAQVLSASASPVELQKTEPSAVSSVTGSPAVTRPQPVNINKSESLAEEVNLLASVNSAIQSHDGGQALRLLRTYDRQFKKPQLREERAAAGVLALCAAGQVAAARTEAKRFQSTWPRSPLTARVVDSCIASK